MPLSLTAIARRVSCLIAVVLALLGLSPFAANAGLSSGLRGLLQGALGTDLRIDSFVLDKSESSVGETLRATVSISNAGKASAVSTLLTFWATAGSASTSNAYRLATARLGTLPSTTRITYVGTFPVPNFGRPGTYRIFATVESSSTEANKQNNTRAKTLQIIGPSFSDTEPTPVSDSDSSSSLPPAPNPVAGGGSSSPPTSTTDSSPPAVSTPPPPPSQALPPLPPGPPVASGPAAPAPPAPPSGEGSTPPTPAPPPPSSGDASTPPTDVLCDYYASPNGSGNGLTRSTPFKIQHFWAVATSGRVLCLLDGLYRGSDNMIDPPLGLSGTSRARITIRALNDGRVLIDGQFVRRALQFQNNDWWIVEGVNLKNGTNRLRSSNNNILRRIVAWDTSESGTMGGTVVVLDNGSSFNLLQDVAAFGAGRKQLLLIGGANANTLRRIWTRWEGYQILQGPVSTSIVYGSYNNVCENCLATWSGESMPEAYDVYDVGGNNTGQHVTNFRIAGAPNVPGGALGADHLNNVTNKCANAKYLGSIAYIKATDRLPRRHLDNALIGSAIGSNSLACFSFRHTLAVISPSHPDFNSTFRAWNLLNYSQGLGTFSAHNITSIRGSSRQDAFGSQWDVQNFSAGTSLSAVANPWSTTGNGANLCKRWVNGVVTNEPLWPWPMNQRIKDATASAGAYSGPCPTCVGGRAARTATDVTADIQGLLGLIPAACRR